ncbi:MAG: MBL fold metallo-hydrolase [Desulfobacterales bacterium]
MGYDHHILLPGVPASSARGALGWCSVVLVRGAGQNIIFDTGSHGDRRQLIGALDRLDIAPADIQSVYLSHFHYDHALNADIFPNARLLVSVKEWEYVQSGAFRKAGDPFVPTSLIAWAAERVELFEAGQDLLPGLVALPLPGHTPGLCGLLLEQEKTLLAGDGVKNGWEFARRQPPPCFFSTRAALESYERAAAAAKLIVPGHDRPFRVGPEGKIAYVAESSVEISFFPDPGAPPRTIPLSSNESI